MKKSYTSLLEKNKKWVAEQLEQDPEYFKKLAVGQAPEYMWIGCSDSRVPANQITGTQPGDMFVHRNIANMVVHSDMNMLSVLSYAVEVLKVKHIIVCGHYECGGVLAAMEHKQYGLIDNWLRHIKDVYKMYYNELESIADFKLRAKRLVELNVKEQVYDLCKTTIVQNAWKSGQSLAVHGWVYSIDDGIIRDMDVTFTSEEDLPFMYRV
jgi:carbonic anhydrase